MIETDRQTYPIVSYPARLFIGISAFHAGDDKNSFVECNKQRSPH